MKLISERDRRQLSQERMVQYSPPSDIDVVEPSFGEVFAASVGFVIDEEQSTSSMYNNESLTHRQTAVADLAADGFDLSPYIDQSGEVDYDRLSTVAPSVLSNEALFNQRNELLAKRRAYSEDVKERGSGMAQFLGAMTGYMLDPVNVATLPIGASASVLRGLGVMARVGRVAAIEGAVGLTAESLIQPFVFQHKNEIGSPYSVDDALTAIGTAALGGAALGGATAGVAGVLRRVGRIADDYPGDIDAQGSAEVMMKASEDILKNPDRHIVSDAVNSEAEFFFSRTSDEIQVEIGRIDSLDDVSPSDALRRDVAQAVLDTRKGRKRVDIEAETAPSDVERIYHGTASEFDEFDIKKSSDGTVWFTNSRKAIEAGEVAASGSGRIVERYINRSDLKLAGWDEIDKYSVDELIGQGYDGVRMPDGDEVTYQIFFPEKLKRDAPVPAKKDPATYPKKLKEALKEVEHRRLVDTDIEYMRRLESERTSVKKATPDTYEVNAERLGPEAYEQADIDAFEALGEDGIIRMGDDNVSAREFIDKRNIELEGLEAARVCSIV